MKTLLKKLVILAAVLGIVGGASFSAPTQAKAIGVVYLNQRHTQMTQWIGYPNYKYVTISDVWDEEVAVTYRSGVNTIQTGYNSWYLGWTDGYEYVHYYHYVGY